MPSLMQFVKGDTLSCMKHYAFKVHCNKKRRVTDQTRQQCLWQQQLRQGRQYRFIVPLDQPFSKVNVFFAQISFFLLVIFTNYFPVGDSKI